MIDPSTPTVRPLVNEKTSGSAPLAVRQAKMKKVRGKSKALTVVPEAAIASSPEKVAQPPAEKNSAHEEDGEDGELLFSFF